MITGNDSPKASSRNTPHEVLEGIEGTRCGSIIDEEQKTRHRV